ncbi:MAG: diaminopimelate epimerase [Elusimicrobia bacterium]|nr:diaminopimelate epimerase [Elusimicrobiota bacterium]
MKIRFFKLSGAGNDFALLPSRPRGADLGKLSRGLCDRRLGVGADGLLVLSGSRTRPALDYFNADGSQAFCGNGSRCAAWWLYRSGRTRGKKQFSILTSQGRLEARIAGPGKVSLSMPEPRDIRLGLSLKAAGRILRVHFLDTGAPHAVLEVSDLEKTQVLDLGRVLRRHPAFKPMGTNVDFIRIRAGTVAVRTYERGVEAETLACGTGAVAAAAAGFLLGKCRPPVRVLTRGGDTLKVHFRARGQRLSEVRLEGPARIAFQGEIEL